MVYVVTVARKGAETGASPVLPIIFPYGVAVAQEAVTLQVLVGLRSGGAMGIGVMVARLTLNQEESVRNRYPLPYQNLISWRFCV